MATNKKAVKKSEKNIEFHTYGSYVFGVGLLIALIASFLGHYKVLSSTGLKGVAITLILLGFVIGLLNVTNKEVIPFLIASIVFISLLEPFFSSLIQALGISRTSPILPLLGGIFVNLMLLLVPAAFIVALKVIFLTAKDE